MKLSSPRFKIFAASAVLLAAIQSLSAQISYVSGTYTQDFDSLTSAPTTTAVSIAGVYTGSANVAGTQAVIPAPATSSPLLGWSGARAGGTGTSGNFIADYGNANSGAIYSYGASGSTERALGVVASGSNVMAFGAEFKNDTGGIITSLTISYQAEFWRSSTSLKNTLAFAYGVADGTITSTNYLSAASMTAATSLNLVGPDPVTVIVPPATAPVNGALDGNTNGAAVSATIVGLSIPAGSSFFIRWTDVNDAGNDAGLAIDNFSLSATVSTGGDVSIGAGNLFTPSSFCGTAFTAADTAVFDGAATTITLSGPVVAGGLRFPFNGYTLAGTASDSISLTGAVNVGGGATATISGVVAGSIGLSKIGPGTLALAGANTFTGNTTVSTGTLSVASDSALGDAGNDLTVNGTFASTSSALTLGVGRTLAGTGAITTPAAGSLTLDGPLAAGTLTFTGLQTLNLGGATNSVSTLAFNDPVTLNITGGALQVGTGFTFGGASTVAGSFSFTSGTKPVVVATGTATFNGTVTLGGGRLQKTGLGTLDLAASATVAGAGGIQLGIVGDEATRREGGTLVVNDASDLGTLQMFMNSGTLSFSQPITAPIGISIGGRAVSADGTSPIALPSFAGANATFTTGSCYFFYSTASGLATFDAVAFDVNNVTRFEGTFAKTGSSETVAAANPVFVLIGGTGNAVFAGNASVLVDDFDLEDSVTLTIDGQLGGRRIFVDAGTTLAGSGTYLGKAAASIDPVVLVNGTLNPTGFLTLDAGLTLNSVAELDINGEVYDRVTVTNSASTTVAQGTLTYGGELKLDFGAPAVNGTYDLFAVGTNVVRSGNFASVVLVGSHTDTLTLSGTVWSVTDGTGKTFSFDESTGILTVTGGVSPTTPLEDWMILNFGTAVDTAGVLYGPAEDFDGDGIPNLLEYAFGTNPTVAGASPVVTGKSGNFLTLTYPRITDPSLTYTVLGAADLTTGFIAATGGTVTTSGVSTYTDNVDVSAPGVRRFLRIEVSHTE